MEWFGDISCIWLGAFLFCAGTALVKFGRFLRADYRRDGSNGVGRFIDSLGWAVVAITMLVPTLVSAAIAIL